MCGCRKKQHCRQAYGASSSQRKRYGDSSAFPYAAFKRNNKEGGYSDCSGGKAIVYNS